MESTPTEFSHKPVMLDEVLEYLDPHDGSIICDCTLGGAGHSLELGRLCSPSGILIGIDQDDLALKSASEKIQANIPEVTSFQLKGNFSELDQLLQKAEVPGVDGFLFDLGVSSPQLDIPERGFSYNENAPLDMRMDPSKNTLTAQEVVNTYSAADLTRIIRDYSDEKWAARIAQIILERRAVRPIETTFDLVDVIKSAIPAAARKNGGHPAKRTFQALRIEVNDEMGSLRKGLESAIRWLNPGGVICVISYHSLEDRIVKQLYKDMTKICTCPPDLPVCVCGAEARLKILTRKPRIPTPEEIEYNQRAHSAKMRCAMKL